MRTESDCVSDRFSDCSHIDVSEHGTIVLSDRFSDCGPIDVSEHDVIVLSDQKPNTDTNIPTDPEPNH